MMIATLSKAAAGIFLAAGLLIAAPANVQAASDDKKAEKIGHKGWLKTCLKRKDGKKMCITAKNLIVTKPKKQRLAGIAIRKVEGEKDQVMMLAFPLGMQLRAGYTIRIDKGDATKGNFTICLPDGCHSQQLVGEKLLKLLKSGKELNLIFINHLRQKLNVAIPLAGFASAYASEGKMEKMPSAPKKK